MGIIYCARSKVTGKRYIGQSKIPLADKRDLHNSASRKGSKRLLLAAIREQGEDAFEWTTILDDVADEDLDQLEKDFIAIYKSLAPGGYNWTTGGQRGYRHATTKEGSREKKKLSEETRKKKSEAMKGRLPSEETRKKMREAQSARWAKSR